MGLLRLTWGDDIVFTFGDDGILSDVDWREEARRLATEVKTRRDAEDVAARVVQARDGECEA